MFSMDQLVQVAAVLLKNLLYVLFCPKSKTKEYVVYCSVPPAWTIWHVKCKKQGNHQTRNSSESVTTALCGGKRTKPLTPILLSAQQLHLVESAKRRCLSPAATQPRLTGDFHQAFKKP